ncbi:pyridoxamine 5'-phosphate oxidase family protein [Bradyrhizobium liaoningense]|uniref:pyridoxamine 5'-phosphate oxidase family protein n=1 Tax=Bradyrhizobium liaoningense TaxID=43992 RepID=UPI0020110490|nr:pyridoxamine 5'-phosphate oxidase family protein [Bradyrhizobium liaoningense]
MGFSSEGGFFSHGIYVAVEGIAELVRDKAVLQQHWTSDLDKWFENGVDTLSIVLIKVKATRATYWKGREEGEIQL